MGFLKKLRHWCPQPPDNLRTQLRRYSLPITAALLGTLILSMSFLAFSSQLMYQPSVPPAALVSDGSSAPLTPPPVAWNQTYNGLYGVSTVSAAIQTRDGGYLIVGTTGHKYIFSVVWIVKTDSEGAIQWNETIETVDGELTYFLVNVGGVVQTSDGGYVLAGNEAWFNTTQMNAFSEPSGSSVIFFKLDASGAVEWNQTYPYSSDFPSNNDGVVSSYSDKRRRVRHRWKRLFLENHFVRQA